MSIGPRGKETGILTYQRAWHVRKKGYTLVELAIAGVILSVIVGALFVTFTSGDFSVSTGLAKVDLQGKVRLISDWIVRDVRQTNLAEIDTNTPSQDYIKFRKVTGIDDSTGSYALSDNYIEYNYTTASGHLMRNELDENGTVLQSTVFSNITQAPFYTDIGVALEQSPNPNNILNARKLTIVVASQSRPKSGVVLSYSLSQEVKVRNP